AVLATATWLVCGYYMRRSALRGLLGWTLGLSLTWILFATLWLPWINEAKSYRAMYEDMQDHLPSEYNCVASFHLGESEAAMLHYEAGIIAIPLEHNAEPGCDLLLAQGTQAWPPNPPGTAGRPVWSGHRPGDHKELFVLFHL